MVETSKLGVKMLNSKLTDCNIRILRFFLRTKIIHSQGLNSCTLNYFKCAYIELLRLETCKTNLTLFVVGKH